MLVVIAFIVIIFSRRKKGASDELYSKALRNENNGDYKAAISDYQDALIEIKKQKFHDKLEIKIIQKIKILETMMDYESGNKFAK